MSEDLNKIKLSEENARFIVQSLLSATGEEVENVVKITWDELKIEASNFLRAYDLLEKVENNQNNRLLEALIQEQSKLEGDDNYPAALKFQLDKNKIVSIRSKYVLAFNFAEKLNTWRGKERASAVYVDWNNERKKDKIIAMELPLTELAKLLTLDDSGNARLLNLSKNKLIEEANAQALENKVSEEHVKKTRSAYIGTKNRLMVYWNNSHIWWKKNGLLMWKESGVWRIATVLGLGDVKEAYVAALMTKHKKNMDKLCPSGDEGSPSYYSHNLIKTFFEEYITKVTNMAAIREEDVVVRGEAQYAVKSAGASMPSIDQYLNAAQYIVNSNKKISKKTFEKEFIEKKYSMDAARNKIIETGGEAIDDVIKELTEKNLLSSKNENINKVSGIFSIHQQLLKSEKK